MPAALPPVEAVTVVQFVNGDLIAAADMNGNFAAVWQGLLELEPGVQALQGYMAEEEERFTAIWAELGVSQPDYSYPACSDLDNPDFSITNILMPSGTQHAFGELLRPTLTFTARYRALPNISGDIYITLEPKFQGTSAAGASVWGAPLEVETETRELLISVNDTGLAQVKVDEIEAKITVRIGGFPGIHQGVLVRCSIPVDYTFQKAQ